MTDSLSNAPTITSQEAFNLYESLLLPRRIEHRMLKLLRQNKIGKWFSGIGQEAIAVGVTRALPEYDHILPMHRNLGVFTTRNVSLYKLFCQLLEKKDGFTGGRDRTFHFGLPDHHIVGMISHLAANLPVANGLALASKLRNDDQITLCFCGDGATSEGDFHEAVNLAAVWKLPVIFLVENNQYALSTPLYEQYAGENLAGRAEGYGIDGRLIDGNNIFSVMKSIENGRRYVLDNGPLLIEAKTFRQRGHEEASGTWYVPDDILEQWKERDPIKRYEQWLKKENYVQNDQELEEVRQRIDESIESPLQKALKAESPEFNRKREEGDVLSENTISSPSSEQTDAELTEKRYIDGIQQSLRQAFREDDSFILMGQDIAEYGGVFKVTDGFVDEFGSERVRNTPIIESGIIGTALGLALEGYKPVVEMQFADFISCGYNQMVNNIAKGQWRWMPPINITIRGPHGAGVGAGPFHSASPEGWFMSHTGIKIIVPATVRDARLLTYSALYDPNPVLILEHKKLYRSLKADSPDHSRIIPLNKAVTRRDGNDATIITYGLGVHWALEAAEQFYRNKNKDIQVLDLRCLNPIDYQSIHKAVANTNKVLLLQEPSEQMGPMSEISSYISQYCFESLDAPIMRCSSLNTPVPASDVLEGGYLANARLDEKLQMLLDY